VPARLRALSLAVLAAGTVLTVAAPALAASPYGGRTGSDPYAYQDYLRISPSQYPPNDLGGDSWKYSSKSACDLYGVGDPHCTPATKADEQDPQELHNVTGASVDKAWEVSTGRPDVVIGNTDSGIEWNNPDVIKDLDNKFFLNTGELPEPDWGTRDPKHPYDRDHNGQVDMRDWCPKWDETKDCGGTGDSRVRGKAGVDDTDVNKNGFIDPEDLIFLFSNGKDDDHDGYVDNISGWDTYEGDNDPFDEFQYGHGSGEARDSNAEADNKTGSAGTCPNCRIMVLRVGDSFVADVNAFAQAVLFATDTGATEIQSALGTLNNSRFAQEAVDYAYHRGVALIASAADESAGHHNQPSELEHASVFNAIGEPQTDTTGLPGNTGSATGSYLQFRGCTNYGAYITAAVPANSCSSEAVGRASGMAGLAYSTARNAVTQGKIKDYGVLDGTGGVPAGFGISAEEVHQLVATTADDIDNTGKEALTDAPVAGQRYPATPGYDPFFGYGRINAASMVRAIDAGQIPPESYIDSPKWYATVPTTTPIRVMGTVAARRAASYAVSVKWGVWSWRDTNTAPAYTTDGVTLSKSSGSTPYSGLVATLDPAKVKAALDAADTSAPGLGKGSTGPGVDPLTGRGDHENRQIPDKFGVIVQMTVTAKDANGTAVKNLHGGPLVGIATKDVNVHDDPALLPGFPKDLQGDGAAAPRYADLNDDGKDELVVATSNGLVHAYEADGSELQGWPVHTTPIPSAALPYAKAYNSSEITRPIYSATLRPPAIGDINRDGRLEVVVPDFAGRITAFDRFGTVLPGFPVRTNPAYSSPQPADRAAGFYRHHPQLVPGNYPRAGEPLPNDPDLVPELVNRRSTSNRTSWWFLAAPTLSDIDPSYPGLEIVAGAGDRHVYAWHADGTPVKGWPVLLRDPSMVDRVDPGTHEITQKKGTEVFNGAKIVTSPSIGDLDGDGVPEVVIAPNEQYNEPSDTDDAILANPAVKGVLSGGNDRLYALYRDGSAHGTGPGHPANGFPNANAFVTGWPAKLSTVFLELLPVVGDGPTGSAVLGNLDGGKDLEVADYGTAGPIHLLKSDGSPMLGRNPVTGTQQTLQTGLTGPLSNSPDKPSIPAAGGAILTDLDGDGHLDVAAGSVGLGKAVDLILPDDQLLSDNHLGVWSTQTRGQLPAFPRETNDLHFLSTPASADVDGDGKEEVLDGTAYDDLHAFNALGEEPGLRTLDPRGWPKFTGGWTVVAPAVGDPLGDGTRVVASTTREGGLFAWRTSATVCDPASWPQWGHDGWNTSNAAVDATRPGPIRGLRTTLSGHTASLSFGAPGDDGRCGTAARYDVRVSDRPITDASFGKATPVHVPAPRPGGSAESLTVALPASAHYVAIRAVDGLRGTPAQPVNLGPASYARLGGAAADAAGDRGGNGTGEGHLAATGLPLAPPLLAAGLLACAARLRRRRPSAV
jgi:hypothetical protein